MEVTDICGFYFKIYKIAWGFIFVFHEKHRKYHEYTEILSSNVKIIQTKIIYKWIAFHTNNEYHPNLIQSRQPEDKYKRGEDGDEVDDEEAVCQEELPAASESLVLGLAS